METRQSEPMPAPASVAVADPVPEPAPALAPAPASEPATAPEPEPAAPVPVRARIVKLEETITAAAMAKTGGAAAAVAAAPKTGGVVTIPPVAAVAARVEGPGPLPALVPNTLPPHDWEAIERRKRLAQRRAADAGKRLHAGEERRQAHVETLKKEMLRAEAVEAPLQPTFYTAPKARMHGLGEGQGGRRSSFGDRLCPPKDHYHKRSQSREQRQRDLDLRGCTFQPVIFTRSQRQHHHHKKHHHHRGASAASATAAAGGKRGPSGASQPHKDDDSVSSLSSGSTVNGGGSGGNKDGSGGAGGPNVFNRNHEFGEIYRMRKEKLKEEIRKAELEAATFTPTFHSRASSPGPQPPAAPLGAKDREAFFERIKLKLQALEEKKQKEKAALELRACTFKPQINKAPRQYRLQHTAGAQPFHERLYNQANARRLSLEELRRRHEEQEQRECHHDPFALKTCLGHDEYFEQASSVVAATVGAAAGGKTTTTPTHRSQGSGGATSRPRQRSASQPMMAFPLAGPPVSPTVTATTSSPRKTTIHSLLGSGSGAAVVIKGGGVVVKPPPVVVEQEEEQEQQVEEVAVEP